MTTVHFSTEINGGAGYYVRNVHKSMIDHDEKSILLTRDQSNFKDKGVISIRPESRIKVFKRNITFILLSKLRLVNKKYLAFGIDSTPVKVKDITTILEGVRPKFFIFYWISRFINTDILYQLKKHYTDVKFIFVCLDEAFLTGGCHYTFGCKQFIKSCSNCPYSKLTYIQRLIKKEQERRAIVYKYVDPVIVYPSTQLINMGSKSAILGKLQSVIVPLGAIHNYELNSFKKKKLNRNGEVVLLIRSSSEHRKGCDLFIQAIKDIYLEKPEVLHGVQLLSIGDHFLSESGISSYLKHLHYGMVGRKQLLDVYSKVDALVVTSRSDSGPLMINEFVSLNKFVISMPVGVSKDLIHNKNGMITKDFSVLELKKALINFVTNYEKHINNYDNNSIGDNITFYGFAKKLTSNLIK
jgi:glycosyltransferase involved in cell wall biosynthesis